MDDCFNLIHSSFSLNKRNVSLALLVSEEFVCPSRFHSTALAIITNQILPFHQPRSQGLSSSRPPGGGKMRDPGNEVAISFDYFKSLAQINIACCTDDKVLQFPVQLIPFISSCSNISRS